MPATSNSPEENSFGQGYKLSCTNALTLNGKPVKLTKSSRVLLRMLLDESPNVLSASAYYKESDRIKCKDDRDTETEDGIEKMKNAFSKAIKTLKDSLQQEAGFRINGGPEDGYWFDQIGQVASAPEQATDLPFLSHKQLAEAHVEIIVPTLDDAAFSKDDPDYVARRLGVLSEQPEGGDDKAQDLLNRSWREANRPDELHYRDFVEKDVLQAFVDVLAKGPGIAIIHGEPGAGKSTLSEYWERACRQGLPFPLTEGSLLPIRVPLRRVKELSLESEVDLCEQLWIERSDRRGLPQKPSVRVLPFWILDGWDEAQASFRDEQFLRRLEALPGFKVLTVRTAVLGELGTSARVSVYVSEANRYAVLNLSPEEQVELLRRKLGNEHEARVLQQSLAGSAAMASLAGIPLILEGIADMAKEAGQWSMPDSRGEFYRRTIGHKWRRLREKEPKFIESALLAESHEVLCRLALRVSLEHPRIDATLLAQVVKEALPGAAVAERAVLQEGFVRAGILRTVADSYGNLLEFVHGTYLEYHLACAWTNVTLPGSYEDAIRQYWNDPQARYDEALGLASSELARTGQTACVVDAMQSVLERNCHELSSEDPRPLGGRNQLRAVLSILWCSGVELLPAMTSFWKDLANRCVATPERTNPVARLRNLPTPILLVLAGAKQYAVRAKVALRDELSADLVTLLAEDSHQHVRGLIARQKHLPRRIMARLVEDESTNVQVAIAGHPHLPDELVMLLAESPSVYVRVAVARREFLGVGYFIVPLARDRHHQVRVAIAGQKYLPPNIMQRLAEDRHPAVRAAIALRNRPFGRMGYPRRPDSSRINTRRLE